MWDTLYGLFYISAAVSTLIYYYDNQKSLTNSFTDVATACVLIIRAIIGIRTSCKEFGSSQVKAYFITRLVWDFVLLLLNVTMAGLKKITLQTFIVNVLVLLLIDGYLNLIIFSHIRKAGSLLTNEHCESDMEIGRKHKNINNLDINDI